MGQYVNLVTSLYTIECALINTGLKIRVAINTEKDRKGSKKTEKTLKRTEKTLKRTEKTLKRTEKTPKRTYSHYNNDTCT